MTAGEDQPGMARETTGPDQTPETPASPPRPGVLPPPAARAGAGAGGPAAPASPASAPAAAKPPPAGPLPRDFLAGPDTRLRDLLAFALAAEAGRPVPPGGIEALRNKAEAELHTHAFRILHNQVETIRHEAITEQMGRMSRGLSFSRVVIANLVALGVVGVLALAATSGEPPLIDALRDVLAQLLARFFAGP
jgi:hypothetical protein